MATAIERLDAAWQDRGPSLSHRHIRGFLQGAVLRGHDPDALLRAAGMPPHAYRDPSTRMDGVQFQRLLTALENGLNDAFMGFTDQPAKLTLYREQSRARFRCGTLGEAIKVSTQFREAVRNDVVYEYLSDRRNHTFTLTVEYRLREDADETVFYSHRLMLIYKYFCWLIGRRIRLNGVYFAFPEPDVEDAFDYARLFGCEVRFAQRVNALAFDSDYLRSPLARAESEQADFVESYPDWFTIPGADRSWTGRVEHEITRLQRQDVWCPTIAEVADRLGIPPRALRRQLARERTTFQGIKMRLRRDVAIHLLVTTDIPVTLVGAEIGFAEPGDFTRAFKVWMDCTPSAYRLQHATDKLAIASTAADIYTLRRRARAGAR